MKYQNLSREQLVSRVAEFEKELKSYVDRVDQRYKVFYERNLAGIYRSKLDGRIVVCNDAFAQILGYKSSEELIGTDAKLLYNDIKDRKEHLDLLKRNKFVKNRKLALVRKDGSQIWVSISTSVITHPSKGNVEFLEGTLIDITELITTQDLLRKSEQNYKKMLDDSPYGILIHESGKIKYFNTRAKKILNTALKKDTLIEKFFPSKILTTNDVRNSETIRHFDQVEIQSGKKKIHLDIYAKDVLYEGRFMTEFSFVDVQDRIELEEERIKSNVFKKLNNQLKQEIKNKEKAEKQLVASFETNMRQSAKLKAIFENQSHIIWTIDIKFKLTSFNQKFADMYCEMLGFYPKPGDDPINDYPGMQPSARKKWKDAYRKVFNGESINFVSSSFSNKGKPVYTNIFLNPIFDEKKKVVELSGMGHDITDKVFAEDKLNESLKEKDILLKEVHHRVKNNLQVISSIFNLQSSYSKEEYVRELLKESQNRIKSMAYIHESLYKSSEFGKIDFEEYLKVLSKNLLQSYSISGNRISLITETEKVLLDLDLAIPCGLIVNEIVSNSLKHAFDEQDRGVIAIALKNGKENVKLRLADDGIGIPPYVIQGKSDTLGFQLIETLVEQIRGGLEIDNSTGTTISISFPLKQD